jgi:DNA-binding response OmpR family regulator
MRVIIGNFVPGRVVALTNEHPDALILSTRLAAVTRGRKMVLVTPSQARLLRCLAGSASRLVTTNEVVAAMWGDREDGGPEYAVRSIDVGVYHLRRSLAALGVVIERRWGIGYRLFAQEAELCAA